MRPNINLSNNAKIEADKLNIMVNLSVSDERDNAVAFVLLERD
jgi:phosphopantetheinyl transferase (holo-ACP synthase)